MTKTPETAGASVHVFLSHASEDRDHAEETARRLGGLGCDVFVASKSLQGGDKWSEEIIAALKRQPGEVVVLVSPRSLDSKWVFAEALVARVLDKRLVPILLDGV
ncbi:MAG: toll/interleukin-1 receptor domain-containing protein [Actinomycetota bacterium]